MRIIKEIKTKNRINNYEWSYYQNGDEYKIYIYDFSERLLSIIEVEANITQLKNIVNEYIGEHNLKIEEKRKGGK